MRLTRRTGLIIIVGLAIVGGILVATTGAMADMRISRALQDIQARHMPRMKLEPRLDAQLEQLRRGFQESVAAQDAKMASNLHVVVEQVSESLASAQPSVSAGDAAAVRNAFKSYFVAGLDVSRRLIAKETGEPLLLAIKEMQAAEQRAGESIARAVGVDPEQLDSSFGEIVQAQQNAARYRLMIIVGFCTVIAIIAVYFAGVLGREAARADEIMHNAWRELELLSTSRCESERSTDLSQLVRDSGTHVAKLYPKRHIDLVVQDGMHIDIDVNIVRFLTDALLRYAWGSSNSQRLDVGTMNVAGESAFFFRSDTESVDAATVKALFASNTSFGSLRGSRPELAIASRLVRRCGGRIWAECAPGAGCTVLFTLPTQQNPVG